MRNACIAAGNSGLPELARWLIPLLRDASPLVRSHASWALGRLGVGQEELRAALETELDEDRNREQRQQIHQRPVRIDEPDFAETQREGALIPRGRHFM